MNKSIINDAASGRIIQEELLERHARFRRFDHVANASFFEGTSSNVGFFTSGWQ